MLIIIPHKCIRPSLKAKALKKAKGIAKKGLLGAIETLGKKKLLVFSDGFTCAHEKDAF